MTNYIQHGYGFLMESFVSVRRPTWAMAREKRREYIVINNHYEVRSLKILLFTIKRTQQAKSTSI